VGKPPKAPKMQPLPKLATPVDPVVQQREKAFRAQMGSASSRQSTLLTGGQGAEASSDQTKKKTLLGQ